MKVLQIVESVQPNTIPWFYNLIASARNTQSVITSFFGMNDSEAKLSFQLMHHPYQQDLNTTSFLSKINNSINRKRSVSYISKHIDADVKIIHAHFAHVGFYCLPLKQKTKLPLVVSFYGYDYESIPFQFPVWKNRYKKLFAEADLFIAEGTAGAAKLKSMGCTENKICTLHLGVKTENISFQQRTKNTGELKLLQIAAWREKKGQAFTVDAFIEACKVCSNITLTFVGEGDTSVIEKQKTKLQAAGMLEKVTFIPRMDFSKLYDFVKDFHVFIHPSCYASNMDSEGGAPIVLLDVQATGMPVISTTHCDIVDEVLHNKTGLLTPEKNSSQLAQSIIQFYKMEQNEFNSFATQARQHVISNYNLADSGNNLEKIYNQLTNK